MSDVKFSEDGNWTKATTSSGKRISGLHPCSRRRRQAICSGGAVPDEIVVRRKRSQERKSPKRRWVLAKQQS